MESMNNVDKTLIHISHLHPLRLVACPEPKPLCHACCKPCADESFGCIDCHYFLHITCATTKRSINHPSHPAHTLNLELTPPNRHECDACGLANSTFCLWCTECNYKLTPPNRHKCDACGLDDSIFCLGCRECNYDIHLHCAAIPHKVNHDSHDHPLLLIYKNPYPPNTEGYCNLCMSSLDPNKWFYLCTNCDYGGHVGCFSPDKLEVLSPDHVGCFSPDKLEVLSPDHVGCFSPDKLEVLSPDLDEPDSPPPEQKSEPQPDGAAQVGNETYDLLQLQLQLKRIQMQNMINMGHSLSWL